MARGRGTSAFLVARAARFLNTKGFVRYPNDGRDNGALVVSPRVKRGNGLECRSNKPSRTRLPRSKFPRAATNQTAPKIFDDQAERGDRCANALLSPLSFSLRGSCPPPSPVFPPFSAEALGLPSPFQLGFCLVISTWKEERESPDARIKSDRSRQASGRGWGGRRTGGK